MQMLRKRNPPDKKLEQSTVDSANQKRKERTNERTNKISNSKNSAIFLEISKPVINSATFLTSNHKGEICPIYGPTQQQVVSLSQ